MGDPLASGSLTPRWRRWARAWLDRPLRVSNQAPHSWQSSSLPPSLSKAAETKHRGAVHGRHLGRPSGTEAGRPGVSLGGPGWWESKTHCCGFMRFGATESHVPCLGLWRQAECTELKATESGALNIWIPGRPLPRPAPPGLGRRDPAARASSLRFVREPGNPAFSPPRARPAPWGTANGSDQYCPPFHRWET